MRHLYMMCLLLCSSMCIATNSFDYLFEQGTHYYYQQDFARSCSYFEQALQLQPTNAILHFNTGLLYALQEQHEKALPLFETALHLNPSYAKAYWYRAKSLQQLGHNLQAIESYKQAINVDNTNIDALLDLAHLYAHQKLHSESIAIYNRILEIDSEHMLAIFELSNEYLCTNNLDQSLVCQKKFLQSNPDNAEIAYNIAYTLRLLGHDHDAINYYKQALSLKPTYTCAHFGLSKALLATGNFSQGWEEFEWRWLDAQEYIQHSGHHTLTLESLAGKRILLRAEWGLGDTMQFIRYAKLLKDHGAIVIAQLDAPLLQLFSLCPYLDTLVVVGQAVPPFDHEIPLLSLPRLFNTTLDTIPAQIPYLYADTTLTKKWHATLSTDTNFKIGICWQSKPNIFLEEHPTTKRSVPLAYFFEIAKLPGVSVYSLQQKNGLEQLADIPQDVIIHTFDQEFDNTYGRYMDTAAVMQHLDLIISIDTSIVHLSGALGRPTWVLLPYVAEWRWMHNCTDTAWYPTMQLFRQPCSGDWESVFAMIKQALTDLLAINVDALTLLDKSIAMS